MSERRIDVVVVKIGAVIIVMFALQHLSSNLSWMATMSEWPAAVFAVIGLSFFLPVFMASVLWFFPATIVGALSQFKESTETPVYSPELILMIGVSLIGLFVVVSGLLDIIYWESLWQIIKQREALGNPVTPQTLASRFTNFARLLLGFGLLFGRRTIADWIYGIRFAGRRAPK
jgi:hypothetical protein